MSFPPEVLGDYETIDLIIAGRKSLARFGDGEYRIVGGKGTKTQVWHSDLQARLRQILRDPDERVLVGILDLYSGKPVGDVWPARRKTEMLYGTRKWALKHLGDHAYGCASVTRLCNWATGDHDRWRKHLRQIWAKRDVLLITGSTKGMAAEQMVKPDARSVISMRLAPGTDAWERFPWLLAYCQGWAKSGDGNALVLIALGATATVLAHDLGVAGIQSIDIGHMPQSYWGKSPKGLPEG